VDFFFVKIWKEKQLQREFCSMPPSAVIRTRFRMVSVRPRIIPWSSMQKSGLSETSERKAVLININIARVYLRLRFAAQAVLKARRNGVGNLSSRAKAKVYLSAQPCSAGEIFKGYRLSVLRSGFVHDGRKKLSNVSIAMRVITVD